MMDSVLNSKNDRKARIAAFIFAIILIFLILYPFWSYPFPPPEKAGILVSFGEIEITGADDLKESQNEIVETPDNEDQKKKSSVVVGKEEKKAKKTPPIEESVKTDVISAEESPIVAKKKEVAKNLEVAETKKDLAAERAEEEAKKEEEFAKAKKQFGEFIGKGSGKGIENGNAGDPKGDPNTNALSGISKGKGLIQGGLSDRGLLYEPEIDENSQKSGKVVVKVCVNNKGEITEASYTQRGSTTTDSDLVKAAIEGAKKYRFSKSPLERQCGTITIEFKLK